MSFMRAGLLVGLIMVAACVPRRHPPPPAPAPPVQQPRPAPLPPPPPPRADWRDLPLTPGTWIYRPGETSQALYGAPNSEAQFAVRCDRARGQVSLWREGRAAGTMTVRTTGQSRTLPMSVQAEPLQYVWAALPANDRFLDEIVFSRGRFTVEVPGLPMLVLPAWAEPARVIEDCRG
jgi:hypothetical protein